jgi:hypothetical protein
MNSRRSAEGAEYTNPFLVGSRALLSGWNPYTEPNDDNFTMNRFRVDPVAGYLCLSRPKNKKTCLDQAGS